tara:strand:- start:1114 stop:1593 length:480 start_codon:yes stop_codon:yes gene_type:complete
MTESLAEMFKKQVPKDIKVYDFTLIAERNERIIFETINACINDKTKLVLFRTTNKVKKNMAKYVALIPMRALSQFQSDVPWVAFHSDSSYGPHVEINQERAVEQAIDVFFSKNTCCVCLEPLQDTESTIMKCCNQLIHDHCLRQCLEKNQNCPLCRGGL